jgi:hypothetical protein
LVPSACATQISSLPERPEEKAILVPSGEYSACQSLLVEAMIGLGWGVPERETKLPYTTTSLEAFQAYALGRRQQNLGLRGAIPFYRRATDLDPNFATAYNLLGVMYCNRPWQEAWSGSLRKVRH